MSVIVIITNTYTEAMPTMVAWQNSEQIDLSDVHNIFLTNYQSKQPEHPNLEVYYLEAFYLPVDNLQNICLVGHGWISHTSKIC